MVNPLTLWLSKLGNYFVCNRFAVKTLQWSLEFVIPKNFEQDTIATSICEESSLNVIAVTCNGLSPNALPSYTDDDMNPETDVTYRTRNLFSVPKTDSITSLLMFYIY